MIPRLTTTEMNAEHTIRPYAGWQLLEWDGQAREILICKSRAAHERTKAKNLVILCDAAAATWLRSRAAQV